MNPRVVITAKFSGCWNRDVNGSITVTANGDDVEYDWVIDGNDVVVTATYLAETEMLSSRSAVRTALETRPRHRLRLQLIPLLRSSLTSNLLTNRSMLWSLSSV